jgi:hypothetical protein
MNNLHDDFEIQWQHRQQALNETQDRVPGDEAILKMARKAQKEDEIKKRWVPYAAAACLFLGVMLYGLRFPNTAVKFLCNSGCSIEEVIISANKIVNQ